MPDMNDFHAFKSTGGGNGGGGGFGCSPGFWTIVIIIALLWLLGQCSG